MASTSTQSSRMAAFMDSAAELLESSKQKLEKKVQKRKDHPETSSVLREPMD